MSELSRTAHTPAVDDRLAKGAGAVGRIVAGGDIRNVDTSAGGAVNIVAQVRLSSGGEPGGTGPMGRATEAAAVSGAFASAANATAGPGCVGAGTTVPARFGTQPTEACSLIVGGTACAQLDSAAQGTVGRSGDEPDRRPPHAGARRSRHGLRPPPHLEGLVEVRCVGRFITTCRTRFKRTVVESLPSKR